MKKSTLILLAALFTANLSAEERVVTSLAGDAETEGGFRFEMKALQSGDVLTFNIPDGDEIVLEGSSGLSDGEGKVFVIDGINKATGNRITFTSNGDNFPFFSGIGSNAHLMDVTFRNIIVTNFNYAGNGAGFKLGNSKLDGDPSDPSRFATLRLENVEISNCVVTGAANGGGALFNGRGVNVIADKCLFANNSSDESASGSSKGGGAIGTTGSGGSFLFTNCTFYGNSAALGRGGAIYTGMDCKVINCTFTGNRAFNGGGFYGHNAGKMYTLINTICYNNIDENETGDIRRNNGDFTIYNCLATVVSPALAENFDSNGNILTTPAMKVFENDVAPELKDNGGNTLTVALHATQSMAAKAGIATAPAGIDVTIPTVDQRGYTRAAKPCMGAFELGGIEPVGIQTATADAKFNYSVEKGRLVIAESGECRIFNMLGAKITELTINGSAPINLESGIYIVRFMNEAGTSVAKVLIP